MIKTIYQCDLCGKGYDTQSEYDYCMNSHVGYVGVVDAKYNNDKEFRLNMPTDILLELNDGTKQWYRKS